MTVEDKFADEILSDDELDVVVGGQTAGGDYLGQMVRTLEANGLGDYLVYGQNPGETIVNSFRKYGIEVNVEVLGHELYSRELISRDAIGTCYFYFKFGGEWYEIDNERGGFGRDVDWLSYFKKAVGRLY